MSNIQTAWVTQFCEHYRLWSRKVNISMRQVHKAGEKMFVDYSGLTMEVTNPKTGEISKAEVFVAALGASGYSYAGSQCEPEET